MRLLRFLLGRSPTALALAVLIGILSGSTSAALVALVHRSLRDLEHPHPLTFVAFVALCGLNPISRMISEYVLLGIGQGSVMDLRLRLTRRILSSPLARLEALGSHRLLATLVDDVNALSLALVQLPAVSVAIAILVGCLAYLAWLSWALFGLLIAVMVLGAASYQVSLLAGERRFHAAREERDRLFDHFRGLTGGIQELKLHHRRAAAFVELVRRSSRALYRHYVTSYTLFNVAANWGHLLFFVVLGFLLFGGPAWLGVGGEALTGYALTLLYMMSPLQGLLNSMPFFSRASVALRKIDRLGLELDTTKPAADASGELALVDGPGWGSIELRGVEYNYPGSDGESGFVVGPLDLTFRPGEMVFLVGGNGSGKTTFAKLLTGLYPPTRGEICIDGQRLRQDQLAGYRQFFSMVFVTPHLFDQLLGLEGAHLDRRAATYLEALQLSEKVTIEHGRLSTTALSQGQKKRLALLVAYLEDRPFYIFDEWAADQDPTFREIFYTRILPELRARGKTLLVISHDDRYYPLADRILKLELGQIVHDGSFATLLEQEASATPTLVSDTSQVDSIAAATESATTAASAAAAESTPRPASKNGDSTHPAAPTFRFQRPLALTAVTFLLVGVAVGLLGRSWLLTELESSLPRLAGELVVPGIDQPVEIARDALGIPTLRAASRRDVAFATGFVHAQDRFFQMDLMRRRAAGELAELFGSAVADADVAIRHHRFRDRAQQFFTACAPDHQRLILAYTRGVHAGLEDLASPPFEYLALGVDPVPWQPEDTLLVVLAMYAQLHQANGRVEEASSLMHDLLPPELYAFLTPAGSTWDAPILGDALPSLPIPGPEVIDLRSHQVATVGPPSHGSGEPTEPPPVPGSNAWSLASHRTVDGPLLANELHLDLSLPNLWYRAVFEWPEGDVDLHRVVGVTLPGTPAMVLGSNGRVAWGLTNSVADTHDLVELQTDPSDPGTYATADGPQPFRRFRETVRIRGGGQRVVEVLETKWGPVVDRDFQQRQHVSSWVAHHAVDLESQRLETADSVEEALAIARRSGTPAMNFFAVDTAGRIGWTLIGRLPQRFGFDGELSASWADGTKGWRGLLDPQRVPTVIDPASGVLWNANQRMVNGEHLNLVGDGGYPLGARAGQIRDRLLTLNRATPEDMVALQLDDRAVFLQRWRDLLLDVLSPEAIAADPRRGELRQLAENWGSRAAIHSAGYRLVRSFRLRVARDLFGPLVEPCLAANPDFDYTGTFRQYEAPLWRIVSERPAHLLDPRYASWQERLLAIADSVVDHFGREGDSLDSKTWGDRNTTSLRHPLSLAAPFLGRWLDTPPIQLPGDDFMPRVQSPFYGATLRMVVSPGYEEDSFFHMPGGQSGHPMSPHYQDGHAAWANGEPTPFLPGEPRHTLRLLPQP